MMPYHLKFNEAMGEVDGVNGNKGKYGYLIDTLLGEKVSIPGIWEKCEQKHDF